MGSDKAPEPEVRGAVLAARQYDVRVHLVGPEDRLRPILRQALRGQRLPAFYRAGHRVDHHGRQGCAGSSVQARFHDAGGAEDGSRGACCRVLYCGQYGRGHGYGQDGSWGCFRALTVLRWLRFCRRSRECHRCLLDVGANVDCDPDNLVQFAVMGHMYAKNVLKIHNPKVGLLSIGEEDLKGNSLTRDTLPLLRALTSINFTGNVEGRDLFNGHSDVAVCDGFVGNVALKSIEGTAQVVECVAATVSEVDCDLAGWCPAVAQGVRRVKKRLDYSEYGGAVLLGGAWRLHHRARVVEREGDYERHSCGCGVCAGRGELRD